MRFSSAIAPAIAVLFVASACTSASTSTSNGAEEVQREVVPTTTTAAAEAAKSVVSSSVEPEPLCSELPADARRVHPSSGDEPVADFDGDGLDDEIWLTRDDAVAPWIGTIQVASSSDGSVSEPALGGLWDIDGVLAGSDLDGDGRHEVIYSIGGNTALTAKILELDGCELRAVSSDDDLFGWDGELNFTYFAGGNSCALLAASTPSCAKRSMASRDWNFTRSTPKRTS